MNTIFIVLASAQLLYEAVSSGSQRAKRGVLI